MSRMQPTPEITKKVCDALRLGLTIELAAGYAEISRGTMTNWRHQGREDETGPFFDFVNAMDHAVAQCAVKSLAIVAKAAAAGKWQAAAWLLERRYGYVTKQEIKQEVSGPGGGAIQIKAKFDKCSSDQLRVMMAGDLEEEPEDGTPDR